MKSQETSEAPKAPLDYDQAAEALIKLFGTVEYPDTYDYKASRTRDPSPQLRKNSDPLKGADS